MAAYLAVILDELRLARVHAMGISVRRVRCRGIREVAP